MTRLFITIIYLLTSLLLAPSVCAQVMHIEDRIPAMMQDLPTGYDGIDISKYQGTINWNVVRTDKDIRFVYVKATEGGTHVSPTFYENFYEAKQAGMRVGCYHFFRSSSTIEEQFQNFTTYVKREEQDLVPLIDVETLGRWTPRQMADSLHHFAVLLYRFYGCVPMIYTSSNFYNKYLCERFSEYPLFIARYAETEPELADGTPYTLWQYTDKGRVRGINAKVDMSRFGPGKGLTDIVMRGQLLHNKQGEELDAFEVIRPDEDIKPLTPIKYKSSVQMTEKERRQHEKDEQKRLTQLRKQQEKEEKEAEKFALKEKQRKAKEQKERALQQEREQAEKAEIAREQKDIITGSQRSATVNSSAEIDEVKYSTRRRKKTNDN